MKPSPSRANIRDRLQRSSLLQHYWHRFIIVAQSAVCTSTPPEVMLSRNGLTACTSCLRGYVCNSEGGGQVYNPLTHVWGGEEGKPPACLPHLRVASSQWPVGGWGTQTVSAQFRSYLSMQIRKTLSNPWEKYVYDPQLVYVQITQLQNLLFATK